MSAEEHSEDWFDGYAKGRAEFDAVARERDAAIDALGRIADGTYVRDGRRRRFTARDLRDLAREAIRG